ncbi:flagellar basal-body rod protein FlgF [Dyella silvatica]|uniref:flagellar basal-body rod protein FlgF n=1 Tax=Dyella silvatica TaxID=2992128 RepID=UPI00225A264B|nr:flagellar basal-body rod protein FlgF [Dyella silvatica]
MLQALFNGLSGLFGFSKDLDNIGNNISNMNTPGYRGQSAFFENLADGDGTQLSQEFTDLSQGSIQQTGTSTDVAISGKGLFVLHDTQGNVFYTREGHFQFDADGYLVDDTSGYRVAALNSSGGLTDFTIANLTTLAAQPTTKVNFSGNLAKATAGQTGPNTQQVPGIQIFDAAGGMHTLTATLTDNTATTAGSWLVSVKDDTGNVVGTGEVRFGPDYTPQAGFSSFDLSLKYNGTAQKVTLNFGTPGAYSGTTQMPGATASIGAKVADGHGVVGISQLSFDTTGSLQVTYSDNERKQGPQLALAYVPDEQDLQLHQGALYSAPQQLSVSLGKAGSSYFGNITGGSLELSNVDLTRELTEMIIVQRGYQASSRVLSITDSMLQQLYSSTGGGGG